MEASNSLKFLNNLQTSYEGYLSVWTGYFSKDEKKFALCFTSHNMPPTPMDYVR